MWVLGMKFLIITLYIFNSFLFTCASIICLRSVCGISVYSFIYFFGKRSVSFLVSTARRYHNAARNVEYWTVNADDKRPMTRTHARFLNVTIRDWIHSRNRSTELNWLSRLCATRESLPLTSRNRGQHNTRHVCVCVCACVRTVVASARLCALLTRVSILKLTKLLTYA